jgi:hypothetical protein
MSLLQIHKKISIVYTYFKIQQPQDVTNKAFFTLFLLIDLANVNMTSRDNNEIEELLQRIQRGKEIQEAKKQHLAMEIEYYNTLINIVFTTQPR